jgi:CRISPR-associated protein Cmr6
MRALYQVTEGREPANNGNAGLWYDKYCDKWSLKSAEPDKNKLEYWILGENKRGWIETFPEKVGNEKQLLEACQRIAFFADRTMGVKEPQFLKTQWRFITGLGRNHPVENGFTWHHALGTPYLPGPSVKGMVRAWAEHWLFSDIEDADSKEEKQAEINRIFGPKGKGEVGNVIFLDALPRAPVKLEADIMTPHYAPYYSEGEAPGDWHDPTPIPFLTVASDQTFQFLIVPRLPQDEQSRNDAEQAREWLKEALEWIGAGAKTAVGYGRMEEDENAARSFKDEQRRDQEAQEKQRQLESMDPFERDLEELIQQQPAIPSYIVLLNHLKSGKWEGEVVIRVAEKIRELMKEAKSWKEVTNVKRKERDKKYQRTREVLKFLKN